MMTLLALMLAAEPHATIYGLGNGSCASAMQFTKVNERQGYIMGMWTGINAETEAGVGKVIQAQGAVEAVESFCRAQPTEPFAQAIWQVYQRTKGQGR